MVETPFASSNYTDGIDEGEHNASPYKASNQDHLLAKTNLQSKGPSDPKSVIST